jgi:hypothetical protein
MLAQEQEFSPAIQDSTMLTGLFKKYQLQYKEDPDKLPSSTWKRLGNLRRPA